MTALKVTLIVLGLVVVLGILCLIVWYLFFRGKGRDNKKTPQETCQQRLPNTSPEQECLVNGNTVFKESNFDSSLPTPTTTLKLNFMSYSTQAGFNPWCVPTRYALLYLDEKNNYGSLGPWSDPVVSEGANCRKNIVDLLTKDIVKSKYTNVYRQVKDGNSWGEKELVGSLFYNPNQGSLFIDQYNPNNSITTCEGC